MADYKKMYTILFQSVTVAINILTAAQRKTEEIYIETDGKNIVLLDAEREEE